MTAHPERWTEEDAAPITHEATATGGYPDPLRAWVTPEAYDALVASMITNPTTTEETP